MLVIFRRPTALAFVLLLGLLLLAVGGIAVPRAAAAEPVTVAALEDSYVDAAQPAVNFGARTYFLIDGDPQQTSYLKFDIPAGTDLTGGVKLRVFAQSSHRSGVTAHGVGDSSWSESTITYANRPAVGAAAGGSGALTASTWAEIDVTSVVGSTGLVSLALVHTNTTASKLTSSEATANQPQLVIGGTVTPPPPPPPPISTEYVLSPVAGGPYQAVSATTTHTGTLKFVGERAVADLMTVGGGTVRFTAATFDFGAEYFKFHNDIRNIDFVGAGMDQTTLRNSSDAAADTEPFNFSGAFGIKIRDMTVIAGGPARTTSDAIDFDEGNDSLVENVKITDSRGAGIIFDGKNAGWTSERNTVRNCVIDGLNGTGVEFLGSSANTVTGCTITNTGGNGINVRISSPTADQPNKKSNGNTITGNRIDEAGQHGIYVNTGDGNKILNNTITNSSDSVTSRDGIRITSMVTGLGCDDNTVSGTTATDNQAVKTQTYGLNIASAACKRTVVGPGNNFAGNRLAPIKDLGTGTIYQ